MDIQEFILQIVEVGVIEVEASFQRTVGDTALTFEQGECLGEDFIEGHGHSSRCRCGVHKTVGEWDRPCERIYTAQRCQRKAGSLGSASAAVAPLSQPRGRMCHVYVDILHPASTLTQYRSTPCPPPHETPHTTPKPNAAVITQRRSASRGTAARRSMPRRSWSRPSMT